MNASSNKTIRSASVLAVLLLALAVVRPAGSDAGGFQEGMSLVLRGEEALEAWQVDEADRLSREAGEKMGEEPRALLLAAKVMFYRGNYGAAVDLIRRARERGYAGGDSGGFIGVVERTEEAARGFRSAESPHFIVRFKPGKDEILIDYALETLEKAYTAVGEYLGYSPTEKVLVEVYPDIESFIAVSTLSKSDVETSGTIAVTKFCRIFILTPRALLRGYPWLDTLAHEFIHYALNRKTRGTVPIWLHEGIAKYGETLWRGGKVGTLSPSSQTLLARALKDGSLISFARMHPSLAKLKSAEEAQLAFAEVDTAVGFLRERWGAQGFQRLLADLTRGMTDDRACADVLGLSLDGFFDAWRSWAGQRPWEDVPGLRALPLRFRKGGTPRDEKIAEKEEIKDIPSEAARKHLRLGDLLRDRNRIAAAIVEYQRAAKRGALSPVAFNKLALAFMLQGDMDAALGPLMRARELFPDFVTTFVNLGKIYLDRKDYDRSLENYLKANALNPFDPGIHAGLTVIYREKGLAGPRAREERIAALLRERPAGGR